MGFRRSEMKKSKWFVVLLVLGLALGLAASLAACGDDTTATTAGEGTTTTAKAAADTGQTWELKFSYGVPSSSSLSVGCVLPWAAAVTEATGGRVTFKHYAEGTLAKDEQQYDFLLSGASDLSVIEPEYTAGTFQVFEMGSLPGLFPNPSVAAATMWDVGQKYGDEMKDIKVLAIACIAGAQYVGGKEVKVPADIAGVKMRSGGKVESWMLKQLGAEAIDIPLGDLGTSLERGVADGALLSWSLVMISGAVRFTEYRSELNLFYRPWLICMNKDVWDSMPPNIQEAIMSVSGQIPSATYAVSNELITNESKTSMEKADAKLGNPPVYVPTEAERVLWTEAVKPVWQKWIGELAASNSPYAAQGQEILDFVAGKNAEYSTFYEKYLPEAQKVLDARFAK
jgi:TRAP-type C4-dicarboxylate transport system substrate-binding protein